MDYLGEPIWKNWKKVVFRFLFLFLGFYLLNYELVFLFITLNQFDKVYPIYNFLEKPVYWMDKHIFHTGFNPVAQDMPGDNHYGVAYYLTAFLLFFIVTIVWTVLDKRRPNYTKLYFWFRVYIRYTGCIDYAELWY